MIETSKIRNFSIIAHIDHGKSTLADRLLLHTGAITPREFRAQLLDDMELERERGITIKAAAVRIQHKGYTLNLIDTPGHIDFTYEVSKSLAACEGVLLLVDATQGIQAQTVTNLYLAMERDLVIIPIITKMDLPNADPEKVRKEVATFLGIDESEILITSAKSGEGTEEILQAIVDRIPPPKGDQSAPLKALIFDSKFDSYKGVISYFRVMAGTVRAKDKIIMMQTGVIYEVEEVGVFMPKPQPVESLSVGAVGYLTATIRTVSDVKIGDTITQAENPASEPLEGYQEIKPMVFCGLYPIQQDEFTALRDALEIDPRPPERDRCRRVLARTPGCRVDPPRAPASSRSALVGMRSPQLAWSQLRPVIQVVLGVESAFCLSELIAALWVRSATPALSISAKFAARTLVRFPSSLSP